MKITLQRTPTTHPIHPQKLKASDEHSYITIANNGVSNNKYGHNNGNNNNNNNNYSIINKNNNLYRSLKECQIKFY